LTQSGVVYSRNIGDDVFSFGVSGRLYKSNVLLYDHQTESLWSQLMARSIAGPLAGSRLTIVTSFRTSWQSWLSRHPKTHVLSTQTGFERNYTIDPYKGYYRVGSIWFPVGRVRKDLPVKERILGIAVADEARAYPLSRFGTDADVIEDILGGETLRIQVDPGGEVAGVWNGRGEPVPHLFVYWFAWQAFHSDTTVFESK